MSSFASYMFKKQQIDQKTPFLFHKKQATKKAFSYIGSSKITIFTVALSSFLSKSEDIKTKSADVILKMTTILKEMRIVQLCYQNEQTLRCQLIF